MKKEDKDLLIKYYKLVSSGKNAKNTEIEDILERIGFYPQAQDHLRTLLLFWIDSNIKRVTFIQYLNAIYR